MGDEASKGIRELTTGVLAGTASVATALAAIFGALHEAGYLGSRSPAAAPVAAISAPAQNPASASNAAPPGAATSPMADVPAQVAMAPATGGNPAVSLSGAWRDSGPGFCHMIKQTGQHIEIVNLAPITNSFISVGGGSIRGRSVHLHLNNMHPKVSDAQLYLSDDGQKLIGTMQRADGEHPVAWHRAGPKCQ